MCSLLSHSHVIDLHVPVVRGGNEKLGIRRKAERSDWHGVALQSVQESSSGHVKYVYDSVHRTTRYRLPIQTLVGEGLMGSHDEDPEWYETLDFLEWVCGHGFKRVFGTVMWGLMTISPAPTPGVFPALIQC